MGKTLEVQSNTLEPGASPMPNRLQQDTRLELRQRADSCSPRQESRGLVTAVRRALRYASCGLNATLSGLVVQVQLKLWRSVSVPLATNEAATPWN